MSALFCLFLCFISYPEKIKDYISIFYMITYINLEELYKNSVKICKALFCDIRLTIFFKNTVGKFTYPHNISLIKNHILLICSIFLNSDLMNQCSFWCWFQKWAQFRPDLPGSPIKWKRKLIFLSFLSKKKFRKKA